MASVLRCVCLVHACCAAQLTCVSISVCPDRTCSLFHRSEDEALTCSAYGIIDCTTCVVAVVRGKAARFLGAILARFLGRTMQLPLYY